MKEFDKFDNAIVTNSIIGNKHNYLNQLDGGTKLNIDSTTEIKFDESTKFNLEDYIKMKKEEDKTMRMYHITILDAIIGCVIGIGLGITAILLS